MEKPINIKISDATVKNWQRLNKNLDDANFFSRANKTQSNKKIIPSEYLEDDLKSVANYILTKIDPLKSLDETINSLIIKYLKDTSLIKITNNKVISHNNFISDFIKNDIDSFYEIDYQFSSYFQGDLLGYIYQLLKSEGEKNITGSYYTPDYIVREMIDNLEFKNSSICDPCCGTGGFLNYIAKNTNIAPEKIYGYDIDKNAVKIMKANLFIIYKDHMFNPNIYNTNFLTLKNTPLFDYIITNPPWGAHIDQKLELFKDIKSRETFSYFLYKSINSIKKDSGKVIFLLPISILNVKVHQDIRKYILNTTYINKIQIFKAPFNKVLTDAISLTIQKEKCTKIKIVNNVLKYFINLKRYQIDKHNIFSLYDNNTEAIIKKIEQCKKYTLKNSDFALGIVTGNNDAHIKKEKIKNSHNIFIGKDIKKYKCATPNNYIIYNKDSFQQVADDKYYFAKEKLIYKFISNKKLIFAYDNKQTLVLNSANILIPKEIPIDIRAICVLLNSEVLNFYFKHRINQIKVLKSDLQELPIPSLSNEIEQKFINFINNSNYEDDAWIQKIIYSLYNMNADDINIIKKDLYGKIKSNTK